MDDDKTHNTPKNKQTITPQSAMDAYFDDMFGTTTEDPLQKLSAQQDLKLKQISERDALSQNDETSEVEVTPTPKLKPQQQKSNVGSLLFDEPKINIANISPLIIPAAFPKLAPAKVETKPQEKLQTSSNEALKTVGPIVEPKVKLSQKVKPKLDAKTALALLEKQKSKLTIAQQQRLESKLNQLSLTQTKSQVEIVEVDTLAAQVIVKPKQKEHVITPIALSEPVNSLEPSKAVQKNSKPEWANSRFECLIFSVAGLKLAVPLISLGAIYKIEKEFIPLVGRAKWFMGLYNHLDRNVKVVDTAQLVMPERCSTDVRAAYKFIIRLGGNDWGVACDAVHESIQLAPDQVKWRTERTKRAWLFGTVIDHMCALIDADSLSAILNQQMTNKSSIFS